MASRPDSSSWFNSVRRTARLRNVGYARAPLSCEFPPDMCPDEIGPDVPSPARREVHRPPVAGKVDLVTEYDRTRP